MKSNLENCKKNNQVLIGTVHCKCSMLCNLFHHMNGGRGNSVVKEKESQIFTVKKIYYLCTNLELDIDNKQKLGTKEAMQ